MNKIYMPQPIIPGNKSISKTTERKQAQLDKASQTSFAQVLEHQIGASKIKFSAHAQKRLVDREIKLNEVEIEKLNSALDKAKAKGARESLVLIDNRAYVINVPNKVVITAVDEKSLKENVFTNIDSAIIM